MSYFFLSSWVFLKMDRSNCFSSMIGPSLERSSISDNVSLICYLPMLLGRVRPHNQLEKYSHLSRPTDAYFRIRWGSQRTVSGTYVMMIKTMISGTMKGAVPLKALQKEISAIFDTI